MSGGHAGGAHPVVAATTDGHLWTASPSDRTFKKWVLPNLGLAKTLLVDFAPDSVPSIARNGQRVAVVGSAGIGVFETSSGNLLHTYPAGNYKLGQPSLSADGQTISFEVSTSDLSYVVVGSLSHNTQTTVASAAHAFGLYAVAPDGSTVAVRDPSGNGALNLFRASDAGFLGALTGNAGVNSVAFSADSKLLAAVSGSTIRIWRVSDRQAVQVINADNTITGVAFSPDGTLVASVDNASTRLSNVSTGASISTIPQGGSTVEFSLDGQSLIVAGGDGRLHNIVLPNGTFAPITSGHSGAVTAVAYSADGSMVASASADRTIELRSAVDGSLLATLTGHADSVSSIAFSPAGNLLVSGSADKTVKVWNTSTYALVRTLSGHSSPVRAVAFSPDGTLVASGSEAPAPTVKLWDVASGANTRTLTSPADSVTSLVFSPDGQTLAAGSEAGVGRRWSVTAGSDMASYLAPGAGSMSLAFSPDGQQVAAGWSSKVLIFDSTQGTLLQTIDAHAKDGTVVSFSPDGQRILSGNPDGTLKIWNAANWSLVSMYNDETYVTGSGITSVSYSSDHTRFVYGRADATTVSAFTGAGPIFPEIVATNSVAAGSASERREPLALTASEEPQAGIASTLPAPVNVIPAAGSSLTQTFSFTFNNPGGAENFGVLNVLINRFLDGRNGCYIAYVPATLSSGTLLLVNDAGDAGGPFQVLSIPSTGVAANSQCTINGTGSSVSGSGTTMTLNLAMTFSAGFAGNKVINMAARDTASNNSGWQALGVWNIPGAAPAGPFVTGVTPARTNTSAQTYTFTFGDTAGFADLAVLNVLVNQFIDGRNGCYIAYVPASATTGTVLLVNDNGDAGGPFQSMSVPGAGVVQNSQCTITGVGSSTAGSGNALTLTLPITFSQAFAGNKVIYAAARTGTATSDWQAVGTVTVPGVPSQINISGGSPQATPINNAFANPLMVIVADAAGNPVSGATVTFTAPIGGASGSFSGGNNTAVTNNSGVATSAQFTANGIAGSYFVAASVGAIAPVNFSMANTSGGSGAINVSNAIVGKDLQSSILITLNPAAPSGGLTLTIQSGDPSRALVGSGSGVGASTLVAAIPEATNIVSTFVQALAGSGTVTLTLSAPGYATATSTITLAPSGFVLSGPNGIGASFNTFQGVTTPLTVSVGRLDSSGIFASSQQLRGGFSANVPISSSNTSLGTVSSSTVAFSGGSDTGAVNFVAGGSGTGNTNIVVAAPSGFNTPTVGATVTATVQQNGFVPFTAIVGRSLQTTASISLTGVAPTDLSVTLTSNDPSKMTFSNSSTVAGTTSIVVTIPVGHSSSPDFYVQALSNTGTVGYTATATGIGTANGSVTLASSGLLIESPGGLGATSFQAPTSFGDANIMVHTGRVDSGGNFVEGQLVAAGASVSVAVVSSNTSVATITSSPITIAGGNSNALTLLHPVSAGNTTVTVSAPLFTSAQVIATWTSSTLVVESIPGLGKNLQQSATVILPATAGAGGVPVTVTSVTPAQLALATTATAAGASSIVVTVPAGSSTATFFVQALGSSGSAQYTVSAPGFVSNTGTATLGKSGIVIQPSSLSVSRGANTASATVFTALLDVNNAPLAVQPLAGGPSLDISVQSGNTSIATVPATVTVPAGAGSVPLTITLVGQGSTSISVIQPTGYTLPSSLTSLALTVNP